MMRESIENMKLSKGSVVVDATLNGGGHASEILDIIAPDGVLIGIDKDSEAFKLLTRIQDEVHRFAIEYHRSLRTKEQVHSVLDDIPGVGPKRRRDLMRGFASLNDIREADVETLMEKGKLPKRVAEDIYAWFRREKEN